MLTRATGALLTVVGLTLVLIGIMLGVLLGPDAEWSATGTVPAGRAALVVDSSLASVLGPRVTVTARADARTQLFVGRARADDATAYVSGTSHAFARSIDANRRLRVESVEGTATLVGPEGVDLWQQESSGPGTRSLAWQPTTGAQSVVVATADGRALPAVEVTVAWRDGSWRWWPLLLVVVGGGLLVAARLVPTAATRWLLAARARGKQVRS